MNIKHLQPPYKHVFMTEEEILAALTLIEQDASFNTIPFEAKDTLQPARPLTFKQRHLEYLKGHPKVNPEYYLSNLRTTLRVRP